jgi:hypothetical protein
MTRTEILNLLATAYGAKSYLEIGVDHPSINFDKIDCRLKTGVDPNPKARATFRMTSDQFFKQNKKKFDLIFIDGLHEADQCERDIKNALECLNENGSIVCHDMNPTTEEMQSVPRKQGVWTGDVWRAWLRFRNRPDLSMHVLDTDYGVGVIRKGHQHPMRMDNPTFEQFMQHKKEWMPVIEYKPEPISVCIPAFEQYGHGVSTLRELLNSLARQSGVTFEFIVSDNSPDDKIEDLCKSFPALDLKYYRNPDRGISVNTNFAISKASYGLIKPMYQDDKLISRDALSLVSFALKFDFWVACSGQSIDAGGIGYKKREPKYTPQIIDGKNSIGMPSVIAYRKTDIIFDPELKTLLDCKFYHDMHQRYGEPGYIKKTLIGSRYWDHSTSRKQGNLTTQERPLIKEKYGI